MKKAYHRLLMLFYLLVTIQVVGAQEKSTTTTTEPLKSDSIVKKTDHQLDEVTVSATKVKFYFDKDTVVYNADAFQLAEGSMLDALIKQLPGVELKDGGQIYVNGKLVQSLLLNGASFFKDNSKVMLDNLPSYMVTNVKVYKKASDLAKYLGHVKEEDKELVMDVRLKKKYSIGWIANGEVGSGSQDRYLSRLFVSRFTPHTNLSFFGNMNNLNENRMPGSTGEWTPSDLSDGLLATKMGGINYNIEPENKTISFSGNVQLSHSDTDDKTNSSSVNFLSGGDTYGRSQSIASSRKTSITTEHDIKLMKRVYTRIFPSFSYNKYTNFNSGLSATFSEDPSKYISSGLLDSINTPNAGALLRRIAINRSVSSSMGSGHDLSSNIQWGSYLSLHHNDNLQLDLRGNYYNAKNETFSHSRLDYPSDASSSTDYRNQYSSAPVSRYSYETRISYDRQLSERIDVTPSYEYNQFYNSDERSLYRLDRLTGWGENSATELGELPSVTDSLQSARDAKNSYYSRMHRFAHQFRILFSWSKVTGKKDFYISCNIQMRLEKQALSYQRAALDTAFSHNLASFCPSLSIERNNQTEKMNSHFSSHYSTNSHLPTMTYFLNVRDDSDPLNITLGNANLKNVRSHYLSMHYDIQWVSQKSMYWNINYSIAQNREVMGSVYNKSTGVRISSPDNVNGNYYTSGEFNYSLPLDKAKRMMFSTYSKAEFSKSVDLITVSGDSASSRSTVGTLYATQNFKLDYQVNKKVTLGAKVKGVWTHAASTRTDFTTINAVDFNYGVTGLFELPWRLQLSMDLTEYSRRGYESSSMNTNELVWNARLAKSCLHGNLTFIVDGFDILNNLSNVRRVLNAQGRTESYYNVIPHYVMLHAVYRLNIQPKKK